MRASESTRRTGPQLARVALLNTGPMIAGSGIIALMLLTVADVTRRKVTGGSIAGVLEITEVLLVCVVFLGMYQAEIDGTHVRTSLVTERLRGLRRRALKATGTFCSLVVLAWMTYLTLQAGLSSYESGEARFGVAQIPIWPAKLIIPVGLAGLLLALVVRLMRELRGADSIPETD